MTWRLSLCPAWDQSQCPVSASSAFSHKHFGRLGAAKGNVGQGTVRGLWEFQGSRPCVANGRLFLTQGGELSTVPSWTSDYIGYCSAVVCADLDRQNGCIRDIDHPYSEEGGLAVLFGNIAEKGCIVKTGAVREDMYRWSGTARVFDQQETALNAIDGGEIQPGTAVIIRYEGPKGGLGMQEMLKPTMSLKAQKVDDSCALITDGRYSGATAGFLSHPITSAASRR